MSKLIINSTPENPAPFTDLIVLNAVANPPILTPNRFELVLADNGLYYGVFYNTIDDVDNPGTDIFNTFLMFKFDAGTNVIELVYTAFEDVDPTLNFTYLGILDLTLRQLTT